MNEIIEAVARAISVELSWRMELTRLLDGERTYALWITGEEPREFSGTEDLYEYVGLRNRQLKAQAAIETLCAAIPELETLLPPT